MAEAAGVLFEIFTGMKGMEGIRKIPFIPFIPVKIPSSFRREPA
jgi:hypothetical protein